VTCTSGPFGAMDGLTTKSQCTTCAFGQFCAGGAANSPCAPGSFGAYAGLIAQSECILCTTGHFCLGGIARSPCPAGSFGSTSGLISLSECTTCSTPGEYSPGGSSSCSLSQCSVGFYCPGGGILTACAPGSFGSTTGLTQQSDCTTCAIGQYCPG
jgi:hypothetical protein